MRIKCFVIFTNFALNLRDEIFDCLNFFEIGFWIAGGGLNTYGREGRSPACKKKSFLLLDFALLASFCSLGMLCCLLFQPDSIKNCT